jgi:fucose 4-O-acetylase-like acetyltransferase
MSVEPRMTTEKRGRVNTVDIVKGIAIVLMVFGHTEQGAMHRHWWSAMPRFVKGMAFTESFIYSFHMPAFFFIAGLFLAGSLTRRGPVGFAMEKIKTILYPYVLWGLIESLSDPLTAPFRNGTHPFSWYRVFMDLASGNASWFLITLFECQLLAILIFRLPHWAQMALALAGCYFMPVSPVIVLYRPFLFFPFVVAGMWVGGRRMSLVENLPRKTAWLAFGVLIAVQLAAIAYGGEVNRWTITPLGLTGTVMLIFLSRGLTGTVWDKLFRWLGEGSLAIFLIAPFCQGFGRELVLRLSHSTAPLPQLLVPMVVALSIPALLWHYQDRLHIGWFFHWPERSKATVQLQPTH